MNWQQWESLYLLLLRGEPGEDDGVPGQEGIACSAGAYHRDPDAVLGRIAQWTVELARDPEKRTKCYTTERRLTDGLGAKRLAEILVKSV